jgi:hypothetical protein
LLTDMLNNFGVKTEILKILKCTKRTAGRIQSMKEMGSNGSKKIVKHSTKIILLFKKMRMKSPLDIFEPKMEYLFYLPLLN